MNLLIAKLAGISSSLTFPVLTGSLASSSIGTGLTDMLNDVLTFLMILSPIAGGAAATYCFIRKGAADEQDGKMWHKRIVTAVACGVAGLLSSGLIKVISGYFGA